MRKGRGKKEPLNCRIKNTVIEKTDKEKNIVYMVEGGKDRIKK